jgi:hypothetical protein
VVLFHALRCCTTRAAWLDRVEIELLHPAASARPGSSLSVKGCCKGGAPATENRGSPHGPPLTRWEAGGRSGQTTRCALSWFPHAIRNPLNRTACSVPVAALARCVPFGGSGRSHRAPDLANFQ